MAVGTGKSLSELERSWYQANSLVATASNTSLSEVKRVYFQSYLTGELSYTPAQVHGMGVEELEKLVLSEWLRIAGKVPGKYLSELWTQQAAQRGSVVGKTLDETKRNYFSTIAVPF